MRPTLHWILAGWLACTATLEAQETPRRVDDGWKTAAPEDVGLRAEPFASLTETLDAHPEWNQHAVLVVRGDRLVYEHYLTGVDEDWGRPLGEVTAARDALHDVRSISKCVTSALLGVAIANGDVDGVESSLSTLLARSSALRAEEHGAITLKHLLTMTSGIAWDESLPYSDPRNLAIQMAKSPNAVDFVLTQPIEHAPGTVYTYCGGNTALIAEIIEQATGKSLDDYARDVLFKPLGIRRFTWHRHRSGDISAASGLRLSPRDLAKIGSLYLHEGRWGKRRILPAAWVAESGTPQSTPPWTVGYGFQWFVEAFDVGGRRLVVPTAVGNGGQKVFVVKDANLVCVVLAGNYNSRDKTLWRVGERVLTEFVLPSAGLHGARFVTPDESPDDGAPQPECEPKTPRR